MSDVDPTSLLAWTGLTSAAEEISIEASVSPSCAKGFPWKQAPDVWRPAVPLRFEWLLRRTLRPIEPARSVSKSATGMGRPKPQLKAKR